MPDDLKCPPRAPPPVKKGHRSVRRRSGVPKFKMIFPDKILKIVVYGTQFHPEKSGDTGLRILKAFAEL